MQSCFIYLFIEMLLYIHMIKSNFPQIFVPTKIMSSSTIYKKKLILLESNSELTQHSIKENQLHYNIL